MARSNSETYRVKCRVNTSTVNPFTLELEPAYGEPFTVCTGTITHTIRLLIALGGRETIEYVEITPAADKSEHITRCDKLGDVIERHGITVARLYDDGNL